MAICQDNSMLEVAFPTCADCTLCGDDKPHEHLHFCKTCRAHTCLTCVNNWAHSQYNVGIAPTCSFCRVNIHVLDVFYVSQIVEKAEKERDVGEKRKAAGELWCDEDDWPSVLGTWVEDIPPVSWKAYFHRVGMEQVAAIPDRRLSAEFGNTTMYDDVLDLHAFDDPLFSDDNNGMLPLFNASWLTYVRRQTRATRRRGTRIRRREDGVIMRV
jgi:hypothetical protein